MTKRRLLLNADLGESYGAWSMGDDAAIMPMIDQANIACGYHAGDASTMRHSLQLAATYKVTIGAHVAYPDILGFGRRSMRLSEQEIIDIVHAQIACLEGLAKCQALNLSYVKPHGALYNDMMKLPNVFEAIVKALASYHTCYPLMVQALADNQTQQQIAGKYSVQLMYEAFADRRYSADGFLQARSEPGSVLNAEQAYEQALFIIDEGRVQTVDGTFLSINADSICVHADSEGAKRMANQLREVLDRL